MAKLQRNTDGTITFPLKRREPVTLDEPDMDEMAELTVGASKADDGLVEIPVVASSSTPEEVAAYNRALIERTMVIFGPDHPYGDIVLNMVNLLMMNDGAPVEAKHLYAWSASPSTVRLMLEHYRSPLPGPESELT